MGTRSSTILADTEACLIPRNKKPQMNAQSYDLPMLCFGEWHKRMPCGNTWIHCQIVRVNQLMSLCAAPEAKLRRAGEESERLMDTVVSGEVRLCWLLKSWISSRAGMQKDFTNPDQ